MDDDVRKLPSCVTLNTLYHETQHEIANLSKQVSSRDGIIADLRVRLAKYERTCVRVEGEEVVLGPSTSLVESLCRKNCQLHQKLKETEVDSSQKLESSKREIQSLQQKLKEKEQMLEWPEHEKDREIQHLRTLLATRDREQATRDVLCNSLADEVDQLRGQLGATVRVCEELLGRLEKQKTPQAIEENKSQVNEVTGDSSEATRLNGVINKLQEENQQLKKTVAYVENLNSKWQKYDLSREEFVRGLCQKLKESSSGTSAGTLAMYQQEINRLNGLLKEKMLEYDRLSVERDDRMQRNRERIQMLEQQVLAYIEDFKSERADRERAQSKILDLQEEVGRLQLQIRAQNSREANPTRRLFPILKMSGRKQTETLEPLLRNSPPDSNTRSPNIHLEVSGIQCPQCFTMYDENHTDEYLKHCEECARL